MTVYYVHGRQEPARGVWERDGVVGRTIPAGAGTLMLVASNDHAFEALEQRWARALGNATGAALGQL